MTGTGLFVDKFVTGFLLAWVVVGTAAAVKGRSRHERIVLVTTCVAGALLTTALFGQAWHVSSGDGPAAPGVQALVGLTGVNITTAAADGVNEHLTWAWAASTYDRSFEAARERGLPIGVYVVAQALTIDGENMRWGRTYRDAGRVAWSLGWLTFTLLGLYAATQVFLPSGDDWRVLATAALSQTVGIVTWSAFVGGQEARFPFTLAGRMALGASWAFGLVALVILLALLAYSVRHGILVKRDRRTSPRRRLLP